MAVHPIRPLFVLRKVVRVVVGGPQNGELLVRFVERDRGEQARRRRTWG